MTRIPQLVSRTVTVGVLLFIGGSFATIDAPLAQPASLPVPSACLPPQVADQLLQRETTLLGPQHAAEHARVRAWQCEVERGIRPPAPAVVSVSGPESLAEDLALVAASQSLTTATSQSTTTPAATIKAAGGKGGGKKPPPPPSTAGTLGSWSTPFGIPVVGVTSVLLNTGKVLFWSYDPANWLNPAASNTGVAMIWDPATRTGTSITPPENIWCGGQTILADGRVFVAGGNLRYPDPNAPAGTTGWEGTLTSYTFNPSGNTWVKQPDMVHGRWYPTATQLADDRVVIASGYDETGSQTLNQSVELFTPAAANGVGTMSVISYHNPTGYYPFQYVLPSGQMLQTGPDWTNSYQLDPATWNWSSVGNMWVSHNEYANGILYTDASVAPMQQVLMVAGGANGTNVIASNEWLDTTNPLVGWRQYPNWLQVRHNSNTVILPDGTLLTVGGNAGPGNFDSPLFEAERYNKPASDTSGLWQAMAAPSIQSAYHSSAILLPDATVLLSQDDQDRSVTGAAQHQAQVYSPPYLFNGTRPQIVSVPATLGYGQSFAITADRTGVNSAVLIAPGATTHGNDMHQRAVKLPVSVSGSTVTATVPQSSAVVPPGYYMLFILANGIPSVAKFVRVS